MHRFLLGTAALLLGSQAVSGAVAAGTGWLLPWLRKRTLRPALWGYGTMLFSLGLLLMMSCGATDVFDGYSALVDVAAIISALMIAAGGYLQVLSTRERVDG
ncbi:hypothetical protein [Streptomyces sp. SID12488]|uniref:hypothetical protein n=1 Tax=Streptomyces sp. SID12488 TaxID=2706040 RepID=UPI0013DB04B2|nr:hypothetical protein [Streptomyces sp. SID12488]NEA67858.1 hypothetical protein [Streptomyces sp. SID12488]